MTQALLTPFDFSEPVKAGRKRFWKQILPIGSIDYNGQKIDFDKQFHLDLAHAFRQDAYEQVPVVFADAENRHNMDPKNFGGDVLDIQSRPSGLFALIEADKDAERAIKKNPRLGVSARIVQGLNKADGRTFKRAVQHVLLTMNPRVSGMEPWQAVDLSAEDADIEVVDLTAENYKEETEMARKTVKRTADGKIDLSALSDEEFQGLLDLAATMEAEADVEDDEDEDLDENEVENTTTTPPAKKKKSKTKITVEKESEGDDDEEEEEEVDETDLSDAEKVRRSGDLATVRSMQIDLAEQKWASERKDYLTEGVPPFLLDLAEPVLRQPGAMTIDLSEGDSIDATATIRKMLDGFKGLIDLTPEIGHQIDLTDTSDSDDAFLKAWDEQYG